MKIWHDDVRKPPDDSWVWVRTNDAAREILLNQADYDDAEPVIEISLDHDLGHHYINVDDDENAIYLAGDAEDDGFQLVKWMCERRIIPDRITIHSWNPVGAENMRSYFQQFMDTDDQDWSHVELIVRPYNIAKGY